MKEKKSAKIVGFKDNCIWIGDHNCTQSRTRYLSLAVNVLRNTPKIEHITKGDIFQVSVSHSDEKVWWKCSYADFTRLWVSLTCWLSKEFLKRCFSKSGLTKSFTVCNFGNKVTRTIIFFFKMFKISCTFQQWNKKVWRNFRF